MAKNIVICCDGTWNTRDQKQGGLPSPTNVVRLLNCVAPADAQGVSQHSYYHPGVGTDGAWWKKLLGGAAGEGLDQNIQSSYRELCDYYQPGDRIYLFGFSRGAYTVRSLSGLMTKVGLMDLSDLAEAEKWRRIHEVFDKCYRRKTLQHEALVQRGWPFLAEPGLAIRFVGVWDTVGALGIPDDLGLLNLLDALHHHAFHDTELSQNVQTARHAMALDELRATFQPTLWTNVPDGADVQQRWFPGVHADVGGGYHEIGLSDIALEWMIGEAERAGLAFVDAMKRQVRPDAAGILHTSHGGLFSLFATQPRSAPYIGAPAIGDASPAVHDAAVQRQANPPISQSPYRPNRRLEVAQPVDVDVFAIDPWNATGLYLDAGVPYRLHAQGQWKDASITCGAQGANDGTFQLGKIAHVVGTNVGRLEKLFKKLTGNRSANFQFTRRHENAPWFCLMGVVANGGGVGRDGRLAPHETFVIGNGGTYVPARPGLLYAFANDAWNFYGNNRGRVRLSVERLAALPADAQGLKRVS